MILVETRYRDGIMLKRKIQNRIQEWITNRENALLVDGARQVGKTYIIRKCLKESASSHA